MRKKYSRLLAVLLTMAMCLSLLQGTVWAEVVVEESGQTTADDEMKTEEIENSEEILLEEEQTQSNSSQIFTETYINPLYQDVISEEDLVKPEEDVLSLEENVFLAESAYSSVEKAIVSFREQMKKRAKTIVVNVSTKESPDISHKIADGAVTHTGNPKEGDYLLWQYAGWNCSYSYSYSGGTYYITLTYTVTYYTSAAQEADVDKKIASLKSSLRLNDASMSDYQKIKAIYHYLTENVTYDYDHLDDDTYKRKHTAYAALIDKKAVCQGYAVLFYRMALEAGIDARYISGIGNGGPHGWNIVRLGNYYYNLDATWDAGRQDYEYFLKTDKNFKDHARYTDYASANFYQAYPMASADYNAEHSHLYGAWKILKAATCTEVGVQQRTCSICGNKERSTIKKAAHTPVTDKAVEATCTDNGLTEGSHCAVCQMILEKQEITPIDETNHIWSEWNLFSAATIFEPEKQERICMACKIVSEKREVGEKLQKTISVTQSSLTMQIKQKTTAFKVLFANGDFVKSWKSSDTKVVKVSGKANGSCIITAQSKTGTAAISIVLESGLKKTVKVKVQKGAVVASSVKLPSTKVTVKKGKTLTLKPVIVPITSQSKVTYSSSNRSVATVTSKGVIKGIKKGTAKITVKAGTKKVICTVAVK